MASLIEEIASDPRRLGATLEGLVAEQQAVVFALREEFEIAQGVLDRAVLKLFFYSQQFGRGASDTVVVQREAEDANTRVNELARKLEKQDSLLQVFRAKLDDARMGRFALVPGASSPADQSNEAA